MEYYRIYDTSYTTGGSPSFSLTSGQPVYSTDKLLEDVDALTAHSGGDCPEYGMTGIRKAIELINAIDYAPVKSRGVHHVIVITDASAYDDNLYTQVISEAKADADVTVNMFFSGSGCEDSYGNYVTVATSTGGITINEINTGGFEIFAEFIWSRLGNRGGEETEEALCHNFDIGAFVTKFNVLFKTSQPTVIITEPNGCIRYISVTYGNYATYEESDPVSGTYQACVSNGTLTQSVTTEETFDMTIDYLERSDTGELLPTAILPVLCKLTLALIHTLYLFHI